VDAEEVEPSYLATLAGHCNALWEAWEPVASQSAEGPRPESRAEQDAKRFRASHSSAAKNVEYAPGQFAGSYLAAIGQHQRAFTTLLQDGDSATLGPWTAVRAELEHAGRLAWLLELPPQSREVSHEARVARALMEQLSSLCRARYTAGRMNRAQTVKDVKVFRDQVRGSILHVWPDALTEWRVPGDEAEWLVAGERFPSLGESNNLFIGLATPTARGLYDFLSDRSHPSLQSLELQTKWIISEGVASSRFVVPRELTEWQTQLSCLIFFKAMEFVVRYFGFDSTSMRRWASSAPPNWFAT
jgi:hypothetical protein